MFHYFRHCAALLLLTFLSIPVLAETLAEQGRLPVTVRPLGEILQAAERSVTATLISLNDSTLSSELAARVNRILADTGDPVKAGQVLAELDCRDYRFGLQQAQAAVAAAQARFKLANSQLQRNQRLRKTSVISAEVLDKSAADADAAKADLAAAKVQAETAGLAVSRCRIEAPFDGQITLRHVQLGQRVAPGTPAFQLLQSASMEVSAALSVDEVLDQEQGSELRFVVNGISIPLERRAVVAQVGGSTRTQEVRFTLKGGDDLPVGRTGQVTWQGKLPVLPASWLVRREGGLGVMLEDNGVARFHPLPEAKEGQPTPVSLSPQTRLIDQNRLRARDGQAVAIR